MAARVEVSRFGTLPDGSAVQRYTLTSAHGLVATLTDWGATLTGLHVPDRRGRPADVVLGFDTLEPYLAGHPYIGATVGRVANRIARGRFTLDGRVVQLVVNHGAHHLHGGPVGFDKVRWQGELLDGAVRFSHLSPDGDQGYPGRLEATLTVTLTDDDALEFAYQATTDRPTPVSLTSHAYFNLAGGGDVLGHVLWLAADRYTPTDADLIPTGEIRPVNGTPLDFTTSMPIGSRLGQLAEGYDHNFVLQGGREPALAARLTDPASGRAMEVFTTQPAVQLYTAGHFDGAITGKGGVRYQRFAGLCLETQAFPDAVNHAAFPDAVLRPGGRYHHVTRFRFTTT